MSRDPIVDEVRRARESEAAKHRFDVKAILSAAKKRQRRSGRRVVSFVQETQKLNARRTGSGIAATGSAPGGGQVELTRRRSLALPAASRRSSD
jgi:hypothetical protein